MANSSVQQCYLLHCCAAWLDQAQVWLPPCVFEMARALKTDREVLSFGNAPENLMEHDRGSCFDVTLRVMRNRQAGLIPTFMVCFYLELQLCFMRLCSYLPATSLSSLFQSFTNLVMN